MKARQSGCTQSTAAAKAGVSTRSGRTIEQGKRVDPKQKERTWRTRSDPFDSVWASELVALLEQAPQLQPVTLLEYLQANYPEQYPDDCLRTLQRRVKYWKAVHGPKKEVMFRQTHPPGQMGLSDFTKLKDIQVTLASEPFKHLLYHFRLAFSHWSYMRVVHGGESYTALSEGLQEALWRLGGAPAQHRTDHLSAAYKNASKAAREDMTVRYQQFCEHYGMQATRNNLGASHENGSIESPHGHLKRRIKQAFLLRGSYDFNSVADYQAWLEGVVHGHNQRNAKSIEIEREHLKPLPVEKTADYTELMVKVSSSSTINVRCILYTVPSNLNHEVLKVKLYDHRLCCYLGTTQVLTLKRKYAPAGKRRARQVDYRHVIHSLARKPLAFRNSQLRDDLLPNETYKAIWQHVDITLTNKAACQFIVKLLRLAADSGCEKCLGEQVLADIKAIQLMDIETYQAQYAPQPAPDVSHPSVRQHPLSNYNVFV